MMKKTVNKQGPRDRRFESARRKLHYRLNVMRFEHQAHLRAKHPGKYYECDARTCNERLLLNERITMVSEIITEFGGRA